MEEFDLDFIKTHSLETLFYKTANYIVFCDFNMEILRELDKLYIDSRYPGDTGLLPDGRPSIGQAKEFYKFASYIFKQIKEYLEK